MKQIITSKLDTKTRKAVLAFAEGVRTGYRQPNLALPLAPLNQYVELLAKQDHRNDAFVVTEAGWFTLNFAKEGEKGFAIQGSIHTGQCWMED